MWKHEKIKIQSRPPPNITRRVARPGRTRHNKWSMLTSPLSQHWRDISRLIALDYTHVLGCLLHHNEQRWLFSHHYSAERNTLNFYCAVYVCVCVRACVFQVWSSQFIVMRPLNLKSSSSIDWLNQTLQDSQSAPDKVCERCAFGFDYQESSQELSR